jgi:hypothetical protein
MGAINQALLNTLRGMNNGAATVDPNAPIPRPGQPTNTQITPLLGNMGPYVNQDVNAFNAQQTIPGLTGYAPPQQVQQPPGQQMPPSQFRPAGLYGRQAMMMAGLLSPNSPPGDTYPNGLLGGKDAFRPGGK